MTAPTLLQMRSMLLMALGSFMAAALSTAIGFSDPPIVLLWIPGPLVLAACLARGPFCALTGAAGLGAWALITGLDAFSTVMLLLGSVGSPLLTAELLRRWAAARPDSSNLVVATRMLCAIAFVHAPLAGAFDAWAIGQHAPFDTQPGLLYLSCLGIEAMSGVVLVRALLSLVPDVPGPICPIDMTRTSLRGVGRTEAVILICIVGSGALAQLTIATGHIQYARLLLVLLFGSAMVAALITSRRVSALFLILACVLVIWLRVQIQPFSVDPVFVTTLGQMVLLLLVGSAMLHLLNASYAERNTQRRRLEQQAFTNEVSGLPNLRALQQRLQACGADPGSPGLRLIELAFADMLHWADLTGRTRLMNLERTIGARLQTMMADTMLVAHIGTGRFVIVCDRNRISDEAIRTRVRDGLDGQRLEALADSLLLRASMGVVDAGYESMVDVESLLAALSMSQQRAAASAGRFHSMRLSAPMLEEYRAQISWQEAVRQALHQRRIRLLAQPIVKAKAYAGALARDTAPMHYEILARMLDETGNEISPARFLPAIAQARLLEQFDRTVIELALQRLRSDPALRAATGCCAINITGPTLSDPTFPAFLAQQFAQHQIDPSIIALEITESDSISNIDGALHNVAEINRIGVRIAIDDFGTGLATFDYLRKFRPHSLKIDGSFIRTYEDDPLNREIVHSIIRVAGVIGAITVAECVETQSLASCMAAIGIDYLQGYAIDRPLPLDRLLARHEAPGADPAPVPQPASATPA